MKEHLKFPRGGRMRPFLNKQSIEMPQSPPRATPSLAKDMLDFPEQNNEEIMGGGIEGVADPINPVTRKLGFLSVCRNMIRSEETAAQTRPGKSLMGNLGSGPILGFAPAYTPDDRGLLAMVDNGNATASLHAYDDGTWSQVATDLAVSPMQGAMFRGKLILTNEVNDVKRYDLSNGSLTDLPGNPSKSRYVLSFHERVFLVNSPNQLEASDIANEEEWSAGDSASLSIAAHDGDEITWLQVYRKNLCIWKRNSLHELHGPEEGRVSADWQNYRIHGVGTPSGRTVQEIDGILYWLSDASNNKSVVSWSGGDQPEVVSDAIRGLLDRINWDAVDTCNSGHDGKGHYLLSVPLDEATAPNHVLVLDVHDGSWWVWDGLNASVFAFFKQNQEAIPVFGDLSGNVNSIDALTDWDQPIPWEIVVGPAVLGSATYKKRVRRAYVVASGQWGQVVLASTSASDGGEFNLPAAIEFPSDHIVRVRKNLPLREDLETGGYVYRLKVQGEGQNRIFEVGFDAGRRMI